MNIKPELPEAWNNLGTVLQESGKFQEAVSSYGQALSLKPDYFEVLANLGNIAMLTGNAKDAEVYYRRALAIQPAFAPAHKGLGGALATLGHLDEAFEILRQAEKFDPADPDVAAAEAAILERKGFADQAYAKVKPYIENGTANIGIADVLVALSDQMNLRDEAIALLEKNLAQENTSSGRQGRIAAHFDLGHLYERNGEYDKAFAHYKEANDLKPVEFDGEGFSKYIDGLIGDFDVEFMHNAPRATHGSDHPIFIVGIPRSGTSLVEQIISSHPQVYGTGELDDIDKIVADLSRFLGSTSPYPRCVRDLSETACNLLAHRYLDRLARISKDARYATDKMPLNFLNLGVIELLFPEARIIHCVRDPFDTCLSCYCQDFALSHPYAYQMDNLGLFYRNYQRLMQHWHKVLSIPILNVSYETLVEDQEAVTREILAFCRLDWNDRYLRYYNEDRFVNTLSYNQVRKPIYKNSIGRWRHYTEHLDPLIKALETNN